MSILLKADCISKNFNGNTVVKPANFSVKKGSIHVITGKSGSGKSTFLSILGGMEKPDRGSVLFNGESIYRLPDQKQSQIRGTSFGYIFQSFNLIPELTVKENIELPLHFNSTKPKSIQVTELTEMLGIRGLLHKKPGFLSGGEQQRVAIARAVILEPQIIFADEPTGNLDQRTTDSVVKLLTGLTEKMKVSLVVVTHENNLFSCPHHLYIMENGQLNEVEHSNV